VPKLFGVKISEKLHLLLQLARPHFLLPGFMLYLMGYLLAISGGDDFGLEKFVFGYLIVATAQLSVSFSNDYFDRHADKNSIKTVFSGGSKILVEHPELEQTALIIALFLLGLSVIGNAVFTVVYLYPFWFLIFGLCGGLVGWFYTAPPLKFAYRGLGELATMLVIGVFVPGMGCLVASGALGHLFYVFLFPMICYGLFFILSVELPDIESDTIAGKKNVLVKWGTKIGKRISVLANILGTISLVTVSLTGASGKNFDSTLIAVFSFLPLITSIVGIKACADKRDAVEKQVILKITSLILFLLMTDANLLFQLKF
jgi:1,4-dihydroxy-2-naphthoate octaprenyltransferase